MTGRYFIIHSMKSELAAKFEHVSTSSIPFLFSKRLLCFQMIEEKLTSRE
jgi:hypothetical protein